MKSYIRSVVLIVLGVVTLLFTAGIASADSLTINFETYSLGSVNAQDGWSSLGSVGSGCAVYDVAVANNTYGYGSFGTKSLRISNAVTSGCFGDQTFSKSLVDEAGEASAANDGYSGGTRQSHFEAQWDFASTYPGYEQPGLSVVASPDRGDGARMSWVQMADTPSGLEVNFYDYQTGVNEVGCVNGDNFVLSNVASGLSRTVPHTIKIAMDFLPGVANDHVKVYVDGVLKHKGTSWEDYFRECEPNPTRTVDSVLFRVGGTAAPATSGYGFVIDNLTTTSRASQPSDAKPTSTATPAPPTSTSTPQPPTATRPLSLGGVADYPTPPPGGGNGAALSVLIGGAIVLALGGTFIIGRRRFFS